MGNSTSNFNGLQMCQMSNAQIFAWLNEPQISADAFVPAQNLRLQSLLQKKAEKDEKDKKSSSAERPIEYKGCPTFLGTTSGKLCNCNICVVASNDGYYLRNDLLHKYVLLCRIHVRRYCDGEIKALRRSNPDDGTICLQHVYSDGSCVTIGYIKVVGDKLLFADNRCCSNTKPRGIMLTARTKKATAEDAVVIEQEECKNVA